MNELQLHTLLQQASRYRDEGKLLHAIQILTNITHVEPSCDKAYIQLARLFMEMNRHDQAEKILLRGADVNKNNLEYNLLLGNLHLHQQHFDKALQYFDSLEHLNIPQIHQSVGLIYYYKNDYPAAERELRQAAGADEDLPKIFELLGDVMLRQGNVVEAEQNVQRALRRDQYSSYAHRLMGEVHMHAGLLEKACEEFAHAVDCDPDDADLWFRSGALLLELNRFEEAKTYLERALTLDPDSVNIRVSLGFVFLKLGEHTKAGELVRAALAIEPSHSEARRLRLQLTH